MAEWQGIYKRYLTEEEKNKLKLIIENNPKKLDRHFRYIVQLTDKNLVFLNTLFKDILYDYVKFKNIIYNKDTSNVILQPEHKWSAMFTGVCPIKLEDLINNNIILYTDCTPEELDSHIINKTPEIYKILNQI